ncbi:tyrosine-type recombinase/integrase [Dyadobacter sp. LHD-138]|uniref:tyrosine-type recombinase/integrase n=1 Tax=Dyadobacter sp. LHD-138 TaxID=3071413 RepID=UPI0027DEB31B|nr:tyrosine-type recombinase/integrase [Dyadobacter sp. LHD-138]MDQ6481598.1 tyrosine-type recombinase/integrase [Dyadobacter sp. LHD-138]
MVSYNIELSQRANKSGLWTIYIRATENRKLKRIKTQIQIAKDQFNPQAKWGRWIRSSNPKSVKYNADLEDLINSYKEKAEILKKDGQSVLQRLDSGPVDEQLISVKTYFNEVLENLKIEKSYIHYKSSKSMLTRFQVFVGEVLPLQSITPDHVHRFKISLIEKKLSNVTINNIMKKIHNALIPALRTELIDKDPFRAHDPLPEKAATKQRLNDEQIKKLEELELNTDRDKNWPFHTRNMYLFSYYNAGIRVADLIQLRWVNITSDGRLEYEMNKTGHKKSISLNKAALRILSLYKSVNIKKNDYIFPVLDNKAHYASFKTYEEKSKMNFDEKEELFKALTSKTSQINNNLKVLSDKIKLQKPITFHTSRHSFADKARRSMKKSEKITMYDIKNMLGHSSVVTTEKYMSSFDKDSLDEAMSNIFD